MKKQVVAAFVLGLACAFVLMTLTSLHAAQPKQKKAAGPLGMKLCRAVTQGQFSDTINVPDNWKAGSCQYFSHAEGAHDYVLGCITADLENSVDWGALSDSNGPRECGW